MVEDIIRLLYAEDDPDWAVSIRMLLEENGFSVVIAEEIGRASCRERV